jgi:16S rRNA (guanine527-N7)-methyltransferase
MENIVKHYFPGLTEQQEKRFMLLKELYSEWNEKINVISRQDIANLEIHHFLFSLGIAKFFSFKPGTRIMDAGTGGGLPGIPLAVFFPEVHFTLVDSISKKIRVVQAISKELGLKNVTPVWGRCEDVHGKFDFITGRAVTALPAFLQLIRKKIETRSIHEFPNGILYLKGGDFGDELADIRLKHTIYKLSDVFREPFFETKKLVHFFEF